MKKFDCLKILPDCEAMCCKCVPIEKEVYERNQHRLVQMPKETMEFDGIDSLECRPVRLVMPFTEDGYCPFLTEDYNCNIYDDRPNVCQKYGSELKPCLRCPYQDKEGRIRSRQERRKILREAEKAAKSLIKISEKNAKISS